MIYKQAKGTALDKEEVWDVRNVRLPASHLLRMLPCIFSQPSKNISDTLSAPKWTPGLEQYTENGRTGILPDRADHFHATRHQSQFQDEICRSARRSPQLEHLDADCLQMLSAAGKCWESLRAAIGPRAHRSGDLDVDVALRRTPYDVHARTHSHRMTRT
nr:hypothetical protein CFP56_33610 [Quercus suber]